MALQDAFSGRAQVLTPDLPLHPEEVQSFMPICAIRYFAGLGGFVEIVENSIHFDRPV